MTRRYQAVFIALGLGTLLSYGLGTTSHSLPKWLFLFLAAASIAAFSGYRIWRSGVIRLDRADIALLLFTLYAALSLIWSPDPAGGLLQLAGIAAGLTFVLHARGNPTERLSFPLALTCVVAMSIILLRSALSAKSNGGFGNENHMAETLLICLPFAWLWFRSRHQPDRWIGPVLIIVSVFALVFHNASRIELLVLPGVLWMAFIAWLISRKRHKLALGIGGGTILIMFGVLVFLDHQLLQFEPIAQRAELYINATLLWLDHPLAGTGIGGFDYFYSEYQQRHLPYLPFSRELALPSAFFFADAVHNEFLQILVETGIIGFLFVLWVAFELVRNTARTSVRSPLLLASAIAVGCFGLIAMANFPLRNPATLALGAIAIGASSPRTTGMDLTITRRLPATLALSFCIAGFLILPITIAGIYSAYAAGRHASYAQALRDKSPRRSFERAFSAVEAFPLSLAHRRQLPLSYVDWVAKTNDRKSAIDRDHSRYFSIGWTTGPKNPGLQITRIRFLLLTGLTPRSSAEIEQILDSLKRFTPNLSEVYVTEAIYANQIPDRSRAIRALETAERIARQTNTSVQPILGLRRHYGY